jgi:hypothetical protein
MTNWVSLYPYFLYLVSDSFVVAITKNDKIRMNYEHFYEAIGARYKIDVVGWPVPFINPSYLSDSLPPLLELRDSLIEGSCFFKSLSDREVQDKVECFRNGVKEGTIMPIQRKPRKDKKAAGSDAAKTGIATKKTNTKKTVKSAEIIHDSDESDESDEAESANSESDNEETTKVAPSIQPTRRSSRIVAPSVSPVFPVTSVSSNSAPPTDSLSSLTSTALNPQSLTNSVSTAPDPQLLSSSTSTVLNLPPFPSPASSSSDLRLPLGDITLSSVNVEAEDTESPRTRRAKRPRNPPSRPDFEDTDIAVPVGPKKRRKKT